MLLRGPPHAEERSPSRRGLRPLLRTESASRSMMPAETHSASEYSALLAAALNEKVTVTENGKRRQVTKREAVIAQLVNKSASAELRATKMLIDMLRDIEKRAEPATAEKNPFSPTDKEVVQQLITRLRRDMCAGCPWAAQRGGVENTGETHVCPV